MKKIVITLIIMLIISSVFVNINTYAGDAESGVLYFSGKSIGKEEGGPLIRNVIGAVLNIVRIIGAAVAISMLMIIACKYIIASAGDRADIKKYAVNYIIGALILFGASGILTIIQNFIESGLTAN